MYNKNILDQINKRIEDIIRNQLYQKYPYGVKYKGRGPKVASSSLARSVSSSFDTSRMEYDVSMEEYGKYVDKGRKPGKFVPIKLLETWIKQKGLKPRDKKGKFITHESLAFAISASIKRYGIRPTNFMLKSEQLILTDTILNELLEQLIVDNIETIEIQ